MGFRVGFRVRWLHSFHAFVFIPFILRFAGLLKQGFGNWSSGV